MNPRIYRRDNVRNKYNKITFPVPRFFMKAIELPTDIALGTLAMIFEEGNAASLRNSIPEMKFSHQSASGTNYTVSFPDDLTATISSVDFSIEDQALPTISLKKTDLLNVLDLWIKLEEEKTDEIVLIRRDNIITLFGNKQFYSISYEIYTPDLCPICFIDMICNKACDCMDREINKAKENNLSAKILSINPLVYYKEEGDFTYKQIPLEQKKSLIILINRPIDIPLKILSLLFDYDDIASIKQYFYNNESKIFTSNTFKINFHSEKTMSIEGIGTHEWYLSLLRIYVKPKDFFDMLNLWIELKKEAQKIAMIRYYNTIIMSGNGKQHSLTIKSIEIIRSTPIGLY